MEMVLWVLLIHLIELVAIGIFFIIRKNNKLEQAVKQQEQYIYTLNILFGNLTDSMSKIDEKIWVEGDEELGEVFENIKQINRTINSL
jgi:predicted permease